ncbi:hypothetical protein PybrP1_011850 [[Pythium] brassicae (nom. inval.)]|nr:hypothetical protein PybrP1_011850 [[Pythium] brassicae (nom. inval.)]
MTTALELLHAQPQTAVLRSGVASLDALLRGGFRAGVISELCGEASAGKTQLCLQLLLQCALPPALGGLGASACYVSTEGVGSVKRLHELAGVYARRFGSLASRKRKRPTDSSEESEGDANASAFLDGIFVEQLYESDELLDLLQSRLPALLEEQNTKLVVIDSIAALFRQEATASVKEASRRSRLMFHMANCIRILSAQYGVVFVVSNQVTGNFAAAPAEALQGSAFKPALGLSWSNCVNQRLMVTRRPGSTVRRVEVAFSPSCPPGGASFEITREGVVSADDH